MPHHTDKIAALIGSRICHDLISPVGAIGNGLELLALAGDTDGPEMQLLQDSARGATAKIRQFRLAFGQAADPQTIGKAEFSTLLSDLYAQGRIALTHALTDDIPRTRAKAIMLAVMCAEQALPFGGQLAVTVAPDRCEVCAESERLAADPTLWNMLQSSKPSADTGPDAIEFLILLHHMADMNMSFNVQITDIMIIITF